MVRLKENRTHRLNDARVDAMKNAINKANFTTRRIALHLGVVELTVQTWMYDDRIPNPDREKQFFEYLGKAGKAL